MFEQIKQWLNFSLFTYKGESITVFEVLLVPLWLTISIWFAHLLVNKLENILLDKGKDPNSVHFLKRLLFMVLLVLIFLSTLSMLHVPITAFAFLSGGIAIGLGFGAQNIINNFISGWILMGEKPIRIGDFLEVEGVKGTVEEISARSTRVRRVDGVYMLLPNSKLLENTVINWTLRDKLIRGTVMVGVAYGSDCDRVRDIMLDVTKAQPQTLNEQGREVAVYFQDFGDNALIFEVFFWINSQIDGGLRLVSSNIRFALEKAFREQGIEVAYPQRDIHLDGTLSINKAKS